MSAPRSFKRVVGPQALGQVAAVSATVASTALLARGMSIGAFGRFLSAWTLITLSSSLVRFGLKASLQREIPLLIARGSAREALELIRSARVLVGVGLIVTVPVVLGLAAAVVPTVTPSSEAALLIVIATVAEALRGVGETILRAFDRPWESQTTGTPLRSALFFLAATGPLVTDTKWGMTQALLALCLANALSVLAQSAVIRRLGAPPLMSLGSRGGVTRLARLAPRFVLIDASAIVLSQGDVLIAVHVLPPADAAIYAVAVRLAVFLLTPAVVVGTAVAPQLAYATGQRDYRRLMELTRQATATTTLITALGTATFALLGKWGLAVVYGENYTAAYVVILILAIGATINAVFQLSGWLLVTIGREGTSFVVMAFVAISELGACYLLGRRFGSEGIAAASTVATFVQSGVLTLCYVTARERRLDGRGHHRATRPRRRSDLKPRSRIPN